MTNLEAIIKKSGVRPMECAKVKKNTVRATFNAIHNDPTAVLVENATYMAIANIDDKGKMKIKSAYKFE